MTHSIEAADILNPAGAANRKQYAFLLYVITVPSFLLAGICFQWYAATDEVALLLLGWVTFGRAFDFLNHILGLHFGQYTRFLRWYARINFSALCFGIPFTALAGSFVIAAVVRDGISAILIEYYLIILTTALAFGGLFVFARYRQLTIAGAVEFVLDKQHRYTRLIFLARRIFLAMALIVSITVMIDGFATDWSLWSFAFGLSFIATVPLHIMHKQIPSMVAELTTQVILIYGSWVVFVA